jgi:hypothetical protein
MRRRFARPGFSAPVHAATPRISKIGKPQKPKYTIEERHAEWTALRANDSKPSRQELRKLKNNLYTRLVRHDKEWFQKNAAARRRTCVGGYFVVDLSSHDEKLAADVVNAAQTIQNLPGRARRVSISGLARELSSASQLFLRIDKLSLTRLALKSVVENREQFALRRLRRAIDRFASAGGLPTHTDLANASGISYATTFQRCARQSMPDFSKLSRRGDSALNLLVKIWTLQSSRLYFSRAHQPCPLTGAGRCFRRMRSRRFVWLKSG